MQSTVLSSKFQIVIPKAVRKAMHYRPGERFLLVPQGKVLQLIPQLSLKEVAGICKGANTEGIRDRKDRQ